MGCQSYAVTIFDNKLRVAPTNPVELSIKVTNHGFRVLEREADEGYDLSEMM